MPWKSVQQEKWGNSPAGHKALGDAGVNEWNSASRGLALPTRAQHETVAKAVRKKVGEVKSKGMKS